jgi:predicted permease
VLRVDPGFDPSGVLTFDITSPFKYEERQRLLTDVFRETTALPGVTAACAISGVPFDETFNMTYVPDGETKPVGAFPRTMSPGCFDVLRLRLVAGRRFDDHETARVGIVTQSFAKSAWPGRNPIGQRVHLGIPTGALIDIVGVVADSLQRSLDARPYPQFYEVASEQAAFPLASVMLRTSVPPASLFNAVRGAVRHVDPAQPVARLRVLEDMVGASTAERRFDLGLFGGFAAVALVLSAIGIYGLFAHLVAQRRSEIGIRMALGAAPGAVVRLMLRRAWLAVAIGLTVGLAGAYATSGLLRSYVFGLSPTNPAIYAGVAVSLGAIGILAAWFPSRRAAAIDPVSSLRES